MRSEQQHFCFVFGTRPEYIKLAPLIHQLQKNKNVKLQIVHTGQHRELGMDTGSYFEIQDALQLAIDPTDRTNLNTLYLKIHKELNHQFNNQKRPFSVIVQGDTLSAYTAAETAYLRNIPVYHVEAGLRTHQTAEPWPEEAFRIMISRFSSLHFAPTESAKENLIKEGISPKQIFITGNTVTDAFIDIRAKYPELFRNSDLSNAHHHSELPDKTPKSDYLPSFQDQKKQLLLTLHRRENREKEQNEVGEALKEYLRTHPTHFLSVIRHPNPASHFLIHRLKNVPQVEILDPLTYPEFLNKMSSMDLILTDSGGLQEEAPLLGIPVIVLRNKTERPELITSGYGTLTGTDPKLIMEAIPKHLKKGRLSPASIFGDGKASKQIEDILLNLA